jgi:hypothetical protein
MTGLMREAEPDPWDQVVREGLNMAVDRLTIHRIGEVTVIEEILRLGVECGMLAAWNWTDRHREKPRQ